MNNLLITLRNTSLAPLAVFTAQRLSYHAVHTKVLLVELSQLHKLINDRLGGAPARRLWYITGIRGHGKEVEISRKAIKNRKH
jgi:hypothetical protein